MLCDYNRDGNSYRSPWSNKYDPPLRDGAVPSAKLREIEVEGMWCVRVSICTLTCICLCAHSNMTGNNVFDAYRDLYFDGGVSSMYAWDLEAGFAAVVLIKVSRAVCVTVSVRCI